MKHMQTRAWVLFQLIVGLLLAGILVGIPSTTFAEEIVVIANESFPTESISLIDVMSIYSGHFVVYKNTKVYPLDLPDNQRVKKIFLNKVVRYTPEAYRNHWLKWTFKTGRQAPAVMLDSEEVIQTVQKQYGALGYVWDREAQGIRGIKILLRIPTTR